MNWNALSAISSTLGVLGVLISLVYLSVQIRRHTQQMRSQAYLSIADSTRKLLMELRADPDLLELLLRGNRDWSSLSPKEQCRYHLWNVDEAQLMETAFVLWQEQGISEAAYLERERYYVSLLRMPGRTHWWKHYVQHLDDRSEARLNDKLNGAEAVAYTSFLEKFPMYKRPEDELGESGRSGD